MTQGRLPERDGGPVEALVADRYLDALLASGDRDRGGHGHPDDAEGLDRLDPALRDAARALRAALVRIHPSFRFEERLATRLADLAAAQAAPAAAAAGGGVVIPFRRRARDAEPAAPADPLLDAILAGTLDPTDEAALERAEPAPVARRPLLVGGAITSAALSLVGVAYVAWRASRPGRGATLTDLSATELTGGRA